MTPGVSVVIPTRDRRETVLRTLGALGRQTVPDGSFEVIVVADGCGDGTADRLRSLEFPFPLRVIEQPPSGAAAARNRGAAAAAAPILLFLDDDMESSTGLLEAHLDAHRQYPGAVALGYFRLPRDGSGVDIVASHVDAWWGDRFSAMCERSHRFTFMDLFTGNVSLPRDIFAGVGGFDERFQGRAGEDYELAARLMKRGTRFRFFREAACIHHDRPTHRRMMDRARAEGRGHVLIATIHPEAFPALPLREAVEDGPWMRLGPGIRLRPWTLAGLSGALSLPIEACRRLKARRLLRLLLGFARRCNYWRGVLDEVGSRKELWRFAQEMPMRPPGTPAVELDLGTDLCRLAEILDGAPAAAAGIWHGGRPVCYIPPLPLAEPLRAEHVLHAAECCREEFLAAFLDEDRPGRPAGGRPEESGMWR